MRVVTVASWQGQLSSESPFMDTEFNALRLAFENLAEINKRLKAHREMMPDVPGSPLWRAWDAEFN